MNDVKTAIPEWPRFEDGEPVRFGDEVLDMSNHGFVVHSFTFYEGSVILSSGHGYGVRTRGIAVRPTSDQMRDYYAKWSMEKEISATPDGEDKSRWFELFGTPERAALTLARTSDEHAACKLPTYTSSSNDYEAWLSWLKGADE